MSNANLSYKEQLFCNAYAINGGNGTKAVISAGYSENGASVQSTRMLNKTKILEEIERQQKFQTQKISLTKEKIINEQLELYKLARANEEFKTASTILDSLSKMLGYTQTQPTTKQINHNIKFERLLNELPAISNTYEAKVIN